MLDDLKLGTECIFSRLNRIHPRKLENRAKYVLSWNEEFLNGGALPFVTPDANLEI
jgi:hypothetical protein